MSFELPVSTFITTCSGYEQQNKQASTYNVIDYTPCLKKTVPVLFCE